MTLAHLRAGHVPSLGRPRGPFPGTPRDPRQPPKGTPSSPPARRPPAQWTQQIHQIWTRQCLKPHGPNKPTGPPINTPNQWTQQIHWTFFHPREQWNLRIGGNPFGSGKPSDPADPNASPDIRQNRHRKKPSGGPSNYPSPNYPPLVCHDTPRER